MPLRPGEVTCAPGSTTLVTLSLDALDVSTELQVEDPALAATLSRLLALLTTYLPPSRPSGVVTVRGLGPFEVLVAGGRDVVPTPAMAISRTLAALNLRATSLTPLLAFHGAVLGLGGVGLVVPAASGRGKSTLTAALLQNGWIYGSDEALGLRWETGETVTYPRPYSLSRWSSEAARVSGGVQGADETHHLPVSCLGWGVPVAHVVLLERGELPVLRPVHRASALVELVQRSFTLHRDPGRALHLYADLLRSASCWRLTLGSPMAAAELLTRRLAEG